MAFAGYDAPYLEEYERRSFTDIGVRLYASRWAFITRYCTGGRLLDYGCATGAFHLSRPSGCRIEATGWDVNPHSAYHQQPSGQFSILSMWDVIEHLVEPGTPLREYRPEWVFISTPNIDAVDDYREVRAWRHWKPGEHLHYFNLKALSAVLACEGYTVADFHYEEGAIRDPNNPHAIISVVATRD